jgi:hypothetical protein
MNTMACSERLVRTVLLVSLVLLFVPTAVNAEANETIIFEEFDDYDIARKSFPPWSSPYPVQDGHAYLNVPVGSSTSALMSQQSWKYVGFEVKLQNSGDPEGFREIGFFGGGVRLRWEWLCKESDPEFQGLYAVSAFGGKTLMHEPVETDIRDWHVYMIIWEPNSVSFLLDGVIVAHTNQTPKSSLGLYVGVKPLCVYGTLDNWRTDKIELSSNQSTKVDYIRMFTVSEALLPILGLILLPILLRRKLALA